jgi:2',3'-cyclic-nucleotide 2'-phosphodiesterase (5'-nucleotidase family)
VKTITRFLAALAIALLAGAPGVSAQTASLTILHTNDTHGHLFPFSYPDASAAGRELQGMRAYRDIGGVARRATLVKQIRQDAAARGVTVWLVDVGDYSDGTPFSTEYHGEADVAAMNAVGYDLGTLGNHEFNNPAAQVRKLIGLTKYELVSANVTDRATSKPLVKPYVIRKAGPVRVAVFGLMTKEAATYPAGKEAFDVAEEIAAAKQTVAALRGQADIIVALSHAGEGMDQQLGQQVPEIDVIVGGHSHTRLPSGEMVWHSQDLKVSSVNGTVIVQAHQWGGELGRLDLLFVKDATGTWQVDRYRARLIPVSAEIPEDPGVAAVVNQFWKPIAQQYGEVIGQAGGEFASRGDDQAEYNLVADAVRETFNAEFGMENMGGVRAPLIRGAITKADLVTLDPFNNTVVTFKATGKEIRQILQRYSPAVSGIRYRVENKELVDVSIGGQPLDDARSYSGVTNSYFAGSALKGNPTVQDTGKARLDVLIAYIRQKGTVRPAYDGRRIVASNR